jgi:hypothetical protein
MRRARVIALGLALASLAASGLTMAAPPTPAGVAPSAESPTELVPKERASTKAFYGWQILLTSGTGGLLSAGAIFLPDRPLGSLPATATFMAAMPLYALGGPAVHWTKGDFSRGIVSFGGNALFPLIGGFIGQAMKCAPSDAAVDCGGVGFFEGFGVGLLAAPVVDAIVLGWEDVPVDDTGRRAEPHVAIAPSWSVGPRGSFALGLSGRF